ncbi:carbonic anhydrase-like isoform X2 [Mytilus edulis]|uniref:carbonic anhydrase-like isoform X2 n=1 Tax=Mytilus edulis TaxID=6550 RepID=UPI0039EFA5FD
MEFLLLSLYQFSVLLYLISNKEITCSISGNKWGYDYADGPKFWPNSYPNCGGQQQSPISIGVSEVVVNNSLPQFNFDHIKNVTNLKMTLENNGHSVQIDLKGNNLQLSGGGLPGVYNAEQFHFHWGSEDKRGSEHNINGKQYPMEMHVVLYNSQHGVFSNALNKTGGLAVLAFLFEIGETNHHFDEIISHLTKISHKDDHALLNTFALDSLFPHDAGVYYRYYGSLTTPPCYESVIWTIFKNHIIISEEQIDKFRHQVHRNYANETDRDISDDYRPVQRLNNRVVMTNAEEGLYYNNCKINLPSNFYFMVLLFLLISKL